MRPKALYIDVPRLFGNAEAQTVRESQGPSYRRQVDEAASLEEGVESHRRRQTEKCSREVHFAVLAEKYEPLTEDDDGCQKRKEEKKLKKKEKMKKYRKNVRKALGYSWKCLLFSLQNLSVGLSTPVAVAVHVVPEFSHGRRKA